MNAEIICVGTEILLGDIVDTNSAFISRHLAAMGINLYHHCAVGDNPQRLEEQLAISLSHSDLVILTGGLGPTYDDLTKETVAKHFGRALVPDTDSMERLNSFFSKNGRVMTENNKKQALIPEGGMAVKNDNGTAPGIILEADGKIVILLPGPPREMTAMFTSEIVPYLQKFQSATFVSKNIHIFGMGESQVESMLKDMMVSMENPTVAPYAKTGEVLLRVTASSDSPEHALAIINPVIEKITAVIGKQVIYGIDAESLQKALVLALRQKHLKVATAESCTGGLLSQRVTEIPGSSEVFDCGLVTYSNEQKIKLLSVNPATLEQYGAVSAQTAAEMAENVRKLANADIGLSVTGIAGPGGGTPEKPVGRVYVACSSKNGTAVKELNLGRGTGAERDTIRHLASSHALHMGLAAAEKL